MKLDYFCLSYERQNFIRRQLAYFHTCSTKIIFADGSLVHLGINCQSSIGQLEWQYLHIPGAGTYVERFMAALDIVDTDYVCLMDDADVMLASGLELAVRELDENKDLLFAGGKVGSFSSSDGLVSFGKWGHWTNSFSIEMDDPVKRLISTIESVRTANLFYTVVRTVEFRNLMGKVLGIKFSYNSASELLLTGLLAVNSKYKIGEYPFWMRGDEPSVDPRLYHKSGRVDWDRKFPEELMYLKRTLADAFVNQGILPDIAFSSTEKFLEIHYQQSLATDQVAKYFHHRIRRLISLLKTRLRKLLGSRSYLLVNPYRFVKSFFNKEVVSSSPLDFWQLHCGKLSDKQRSDLLDVAHLLKKFPRGIQSNQALFDYLGISYSESN
ncbi:TIGR00180 family glycosyltransferase [Cylindrospermopsis raciborskii]|uniref:TIGR00180 family glycosyltransferase n=1 Tax=Cylindrospermopsis raciborskii TaxID=77022 RepID=UPI0022CC97E2|nr:TIGR00180 family glycosyltransferase [Cylindrospermopsis raciborskii]MCZ2207660.1 TIGR00180 family glycosyltransferase [Cylindrospermopsis raciborskii PAMP2011]